MGHLLTEANMIINLPEVIENRALEDRLNEAAKTLSNTMTLGEVFKLLKSSNKVIKGTVKLA